MERLPVVKIDQDESQIHLDALRGSLAALREAVASAGVTLARPPAVVQRPATSELGTASQSVKSAAPNGARPAAAVTSPVAKAKRRK